MPHGLRIKDVSGNIILDTSNRITRLRYSNLVAAGASGNTTLSNIDGQLSVEFGVPINIDLPNRVEHAVSRSGTVLSWTPNGNGTTYFSQASIVFLFLYT